MRFSGYNIRIPVFGDEDAGAGAGDDAGAGAGDDAGAGAGDDAGTTTPPASAGGMKFTPEQQKHINTLLAAEKNKHRSLVQKASDEAKAMAAKAQLTSQQSQELDSRLDQIQNEMRTKEEQAKRAAEKLQNAHKEAINSVTTERDTWRSRFTESTIERSLTDAAAENNAFSPRQIVAILGRDTQLVEVLDDDGKPTGQLSPKVKYRTKDKEGKPVTLDLSPVDAIKRMKDEDEYLNLFRGEGAGGTGMRSQPGGKKPDVSNLAKDPVAWRKARKAGEVTF